jgi:hypothetical protein
VNAISRSRLKNDRSSIGVLTNPGRASGAIRQGDEEIGLTDEQIHTARAQYQADEFERIRAALLAQRSPQNGLMVIYPISRNSKKKADADDRVDLFEEPDRASDVIGVAIGFPRSSSAATIEYISGSVVSGYDE